MNAFATDSPSINDPLGPVQTGAAPVRQTFVLHNRHGLHCRPAALLIKKLKDFDCKVLVAGNGAVANGRSIIGLLTLAAGYGTKLTLTMTGPDAEAAMRVIRLLFENNFTDAYTENSASSDSPVTTEQKRPFQAPKRDSAQDIGLKQPVHPVVIPAKHTTQNKANYEEPSASTCR